jgi:hypothetical protein
MRNAHRILHNRRKTTRKTADILDPKLQFKPSTDIPAAEISPINKS